MKPRFGTAFAMGSFAGLLATFAPSHAHAHPHVFIDAQIEVIFDTQGRAEALRIDWAYDALFSLLMIEENGLDPDLDGVLTDAEQASLSGFDMEWDPDFPGDTYALSGGRPVGLSRPSDWSVRYEGGKLISTHLRRLDTAVAMNDPFVVQVYDPSYYAAYVLLAPTKLTGTPPPGCEPVIWEPDREAADARLAAAMEEYAGDDADFPAIGDAYAEEVRITCQPQ